ncbi:alpha/beta fold hydrolase [Sorangium sp. So ce429]
MKITANRIQIHVRERGEGDIALVFLHYWGGSSRTWAAVAEALSPRYRTVAIDHRGWGDSDAPEEGYRIGDLADDAEAVIQVLGSPLEAPLALASALREFVTELESA